MELPLSSADIPGKNINQQVMDTKAERALADSIKRYLDNPGRYKPTVEDFNRLRDKIVQQILSTVRELLTNTATDLEKRPVRYGTLFPSDFSDLCRAVFEASNQTDLEHTLCVKESYLDLEDVLRVTLAAAIMSWIFDGQHDLLPTGLEDRTELSWEIEEELANGKHSTTIVATQLN